MVAIDIAKYNHVALIEYPQGKRRLVRFKTTQADFTRLSDLLKLTQLPVIVAFEPTADYHRTLAYHLQVAGFKCHFVSSVAVAKTRDALFNSWDKNGPKDAQVILHLMKTGVLQTYHDPVIHQFNDIQELSNTYHQISKRKTRVYHSIVNHYLTLYFPKVEYYFHSTRRKWLINFLLSFPTPNSITAFDKEKFITLGKAVKGYKRHKRQWLADIYETAKLSIGLPIATETKSIGMFKTILSDYLTLTEKRDEIEATAIATLEEDKDFKRLKTIPGIGPIVALTVLAETGDIRRFKHSKQFVSYCGFNLCAYRSGTLQGQAHISKRGNARLRQPLWMAGQIAGIQNENTFRRKFNDYLKKKWRIAR